MKVLKYIDPTSDFGFKRIFASEPNKDLLIAFLNELFEGRKKIIDLSFDKTEYVGDSEIMGSVILDLVCTGNNGEKFIIEMQSSAQINLKKRIIFYGSKLISDQAPKGKRKEWAYGINEVYIIILMDGFRLSDTLDNNYLHNVIYWERKSGKVFYEDFEIIYIELVNFKKTETELLNDLDKWLYVLKNLSKLETLPVILRKPIFEKLFQIAEYSKLNKDEKIMYDINLKKKWDKKVVLDYAQQEGINIGMKKGINIGIEKGINIGIEKGINIGMEKGMEKIIKNLIINTQYSNEDIAKITGESIELIEKCRSQIN